MAEYEEKTEQATPRKREKARQEGRVPRSRDLSSVAAMGGTILLLYTGREYFAAGIRRLTLNLLSLQYGTDPVSALRSSSVDMMAILAPLLGAGLLFGVSASFAQGGFVLKPLELKFDGLNPFNGVKRIFSLNGLAEALKSMTKILICGYIFYLVVRRDLAILPSLMTMPVHDLSLTAGRLVMQAAVVGFFLFAVFGVIDVFIQRWQFARSLRMSMEEIKSEAKETEGDPLIKARIKSIQREMARRRMMQEVPKATVVITNPVHFAVALRYKDKEMQAPKVTAKGADAVAMKIREIARRHGIPIVEDKPLARLLMKVDIDSYIPEDLYKAVAKILAYIYKLGGLRR